MEAKDLRIMVIGAHPDDPALNFGGTAARFAMLVCSLRLRESPQWLFSRGREEEARRSLLANNPPEDAEATLAEMRTNLAAAQAVPTTGGATVRESVFQRKYVWPFLLAVAFCCVAAFLLPETKGKSLEEIERYFTSRANRRDKIRNLPLEREA